MENKRRKIFKPDQIESVNPGFANGISSFLKNKVI